MSVRQSKSASPSFTESDTVGGVFKGSLFKNLFKDRKAAFEGFPAVKKGLSFPEPNIRFGGANYTFKSSDVVDKVSVKHDDNDFTARYKKDANKFDLIWKGKICSGWSLLAKYEERGEAGGPTYVGGFDMTKAALAVNGKFKPQTGVIKCSTFYNLDDVVSGLKIAADLKANVLDLNPELMKWNVGMSYLSPGGTSAIACSDNLNVTLNHSVQVDKTTSLMTEYVHKTKESNMAAVVGICHQVDKNHQIRLKVNHQAQLQCCVKKDMSPNISLLASTVYDLKDTNGFTRVPAFGFKVVAKA